MSIMMTLEGLLGDQAVCMRCLSAAANLDDEVVTAALAVLGYSLVVIESVRACRVCTAVKDTFSVAVRGSKP